MPDDGTEVWARRSFTAPAGVTSLSLEITAEKGPTEVYLNGTSLSGSITGALTLLELSAEALQDGENVLAVRTTAERGIPTQLRAAVGQPIVSTGSDWTVTTDQPTAGWVLPGFNDSAWTPQAAPVSMPYVAATETEAGSATAMWLRHTFTADSPDALSDLLLSVARTDGAVVYLNGREVFRAGLPDGDVSAETLALSLIHI